MKKKELKEIIDNLQKEITEFQFYCKKQERTIHNLEVKNKYLQKNTECDNCHSKNVMNDNLRRSNENLTKAVVERDEHIKHLKQQHVYLSNTHEAVKCNYEKTEKDRNAILNDLCQLLLHNITGEVIESYSKKYRLRIREYLQNKKLKSKKPTRKPRANATASNNTTIST